MRSLIERGQLGAPTRGNQVKRLMANTEATAHQIAEIHEPHLADWMALDLRFIACNWPARMAYREVGGDLGEHRARRKRKNVPR